MNSNNQFDVIIIGAGPGGIFSAYELMQKKPDLKVAVFESGYSLEKRHCPIDGVKVKSCIKCPTSCVDCGTQNCKFKDLCDHERFRRCRCIL